ncbi:beta-ketoacyl synthase chain length factor [Paludibacterium yongneupense]|uniref:beta-ketoacyl synthase chain length factor n=1 Tax=Paludibacterium yongneupense TaxID=400061 RepID=UPI00040E341A|nr:beta-ketoacyl synthase chain length factor [Paludibacterium yongneupense]
MTILSAHIAGIGLLGPGCNNWEQGRALLSADSVGALPPSVSPELACLPANERRRASRIVRLALAVGMEAVAQAVVSPVDLASVFASSGGDGQNCHTLCETLADDGSMVSPTRFHNSVVNAPAGYWSIATHATAASTVLCASDASFGAGLLDAMVQVAFSKAPCLLIAYDGPYPDPMHRVRPISDIFGVALLLTPAGHPGSLATLGLQRSSLAATRCADAALEAVRTTIPAARALPLLQCLARGGGRVVLDYLAPETLALEVETV